MNNPLGVSPSKGNQKTTRGKEKIFWPRWESNTLPTELQGRTEKVGDNLSSTLIYTSELILCSTICVPSATRYNNHKCLSCLLQVTAL